MRIKDLALTTNVGPTDRVVIDQGVSNPVTRLTPIANVTAGLEFTQTGTGAVPRTVVSKLQDEVSFKDYGAVGDDLTDDTLAIQKAIDAVAAVGGGILNGVRGGTYKITSSLLLKTGVKIDLNGAIVKQYTNNIPIVTAPSGTSITEWALRNGRMTFNTAQDGLATVQVNITGTIVAGDRMLGLSSGIVGIVQSVVGSTVTYIGNGLFSSGEQLQILAVVQGTTTAAGVAVRHGIGLRLANGSFSYNFSVSDLVIVNAYDGITCPATTGSFAFVGQIENYTGADCHRWSMNIDCDSAVGGNTNLVLTNCWAIPSTPSYATSPPFSSGFRFNACSQFQWQSLFADKIRGPFLFAQLSTGWFGNLSLEASLLEAFPNNEASAITFSDVTASIQSIKYLYVDFKTYNQITINTSTSVGAPLAVGNTITGGTSGATGVVTQISGSGTTKTVVFHATSATGFSAAENVLVGGIVKGAVTLATSNSGNLYLFRGVAQPGFNYAVQNTNFETDAGCTYSGRNIYEVSCTASGSVWFYNWRASIARVGGVQLADFGTPKQIRYWNGDNRYYTLGMSADAAWDGNATNLAAVAMNAANSTPSYTPTNTDRNLRFKSTAYGNNADGGLTLYSVDGSNNEQWITKALRLRSDGSGNPILAIVGPNTSNAVIQINTSDGSGNETARLRIDPLRITASNNAGAVPASTLTGGTTVVSVHGTDAGAARQMIAGYGGGAVLDFRRSNGTAVSPTALALNNVIGQINASGYGASAFGTSPRAQFIMYAAEAWTNSAQGTFMSFTITPAGGTSTTEVGRVETNGRLEFGNAVNLNGPALSTTTPADLYIRSGNTYVDNTTAASGTVAHGAVSSFGAKGIASVNATVTYTNASTIFVHGAPGAGSNVTITNPWAVYLAAGKSYLGDQVDGNPANVDSVGFRGVPVNSQSAAYQLVAADAGKSIVHPISDNNARTFTIPANGTVAYPVGTTITFINMINTVTIAITTDTMYLAGAGTTGSRTLAAYGMATAVKMTSTSWIISGNGLT